MAIRFLPVVLVIPGVMRRLDHISRQVLLRFDDPMNRPYEASMLGHLTMSEIHPALNTLQARGLVVAVDGGFVLTDAGVQERDALREADWI